MACSLETLDEIRKSIIDTIAMVERENAMLSAKIDSLKEPSGPPSKVEEDEKFLEELRMNENINGVSFRNVSKEVLDDSTIKIRANVISGNENCSLKIMAGADGKVKDFTLTIEDTSSLMEIKEELLSLIKDVNLTYTLKAIASFSRMRKLREQIVDEMLNDYKDHFKVELRLQEGGDEVEAPCGIVVSAVKKNRRAKYFEVKWNLKWNLGAMSIEHVFSVKCLQGLSTLPQLEPLLRRLEKNQFVDGKCSGLVGLWRNIGKILTEG